MPKNRDGPAPQGLCLHKRGGGGTGAVAARGVSLPHHLRGLGAPPPRLRCWQHQPTLASPGSCKSKVSVIVIFICSCIVSPKNKEKFLSLHSTITLFNDISSVVGQAVHLHQCDKGCSNDTYSAAQQLFTFICH